MTTVSTTQTPSSQTGAAIVTGASRGIGRAIALRLAAAGYAVTVNYASRSDDADRTVAEIAAAGGRAIAVKADVSLPADAAPLFDDTAQAFRGVDVLVNHAGLLTILNISNADPGALPRAFSGTPLG